MNTQLIDQETLATMGGLVAAVALLVQFTKGIVKDRFGDAYVRVYALILSLILTFAFTEGPDGFQGILVKLVNAVIVTSASMGTYETIVDPKADKKKLPGA